MHREVGSGGYRTSLLNIGTANRVIVKLKGGQVQVFMNGRELASAPTKLQPKPGRPEFYVDNRDGKAAAKVELQRLFVFEPP